MSGERAAVGTGLAAENAVLSVMFVDDEQRLLDGLRRVLRGLRAAWDMHFILGGRAALQCLAERRFDVVVSDLSMPEVDGFAVLEEVMRRHPDTIRIILSGNADVSSVVRTIGPAHQFLPKPCDAEELRQAVDRATVLRRRLADVRVRGVLDSIENLPCLPEIYIQLQELMRCDQVDLSCIGELIRKDVALTGKVLKLVNSAFFGMKRRIYEPREAAAVLGIETLKSLVLASNTFESIGSVMQHFDQEGVWNHSLVVATLTRAIGEHEGLCKESLEACYLAGLMHDAGRLILARSLLAAYDKLCGLCDDGRKLSGFEQRAFGVTHGELGAYLLGMWGCSDFIVEGIAYHHSPSEALGDGFSLALALHFADAMEHRSRQGLSLNDQLQIAYVKDPARLKILARWQRVCEARLGFLPGRSEGPASDA